MARVLVLLLLVACEVPPSTHDAGRLTLDHCAPVFRAPFFQLLEPGRQTLHLEMFALLACADAGTIPPDSITMTAVTGSGANVVEGLRVRLPTRSDAGVLGRASIDVDLDVPSNATEVLADIVVEPSVGTDHRVLVVLPTSTVEVQFAEAIAATCNLVLPWERRTICVTTSAVTVVPNDGTPWTVLGDSNALAVTPSGLWSVSNFQRSVKFLPADGGQLIKWEQTSTPLAIATLDDRVFVSSERGLTELTAGQSSPFSGLNPQTSFAPTAMRVEGQQLVLATQERIDRVPLSDFLTAVPMLATGPGPGSAQLQLDRGPLEGRREPDRVGDWLGRPSSRGSVSGDGERQARADVPRPGHHGRDASPVPRSSGRRPRGVAARSRRR